jgi:DNA topoisomerase-1
MTNNNFRIPPSWVNVEYYKNSHIKASGIDSKGKKQYILDPEYILNQKKEKFNRLKLFIKKIDSFKKKINNITLSLDKENIIKLLFNLLLDTHIRVGNEIYSKNNKTYGLTTLRKKHLILKNEKYYFRFIGKSNIKHYIIIPDKYYSILIKLKTENNKNNNLFWYVDNNQDNKNINIIYSETLNEYLKEHMGKEFTCKDFRTYSANILFIQSFLNNNNNSEKKIIEYSIKNSAILLGHSDSISKKSYISGSLIQYCINNFKKAKNMNETQLVNKI